MAKQRAKEKCSICLTRYAVSREGWCLRCLRRQLNNKFGYVNIGAGHGDSRTGDQRQDMTRPGQNG